MTNVRQVALVAVHLASHAPGRFRYVLSRRGALAVGGAVVVSAVW
jgi:hypothetical protein